MKAIFSLISCISIVFILGSCAHYGGGTVGTGLPLTGHSSGSSAGTGVLYLDFSGTVLTEKQTPASFAKVTVKTPKLEESTLSDQYGGFQLEVIGDSGEPVSITIIHNEKSYHTTFRLPAGGYTNGSGTFNLKNSGGIDTGNLDFY